MHEKVLRVQTISNLNEINPGLPSEITHSSFNVDHAPQIGWQFAVNFFRNGFCNGRKCKNPLRPVMFKILTFAHVIQIGPNDHLLREAENPESTSLQGGVENIPRVGNEVLALVNPQSDESKFGPVDQVPSVGRPLLPAHVVGVFPQELDLVLGVASVPQTVSQHFARTGFRVDQFQLNSWLRDRVERRGLPIGLGVLLPHDGVESVGVLVGEDEADVVVVDVAADEESAVEVDAVEAVETWHCVNQMHEGRFVKIRDIYILYSLNLNQLKMT